MNRFSLSVARHGPGLVFSALTTLTGLTGAAMSQDYRLAPGDKVLVQILQLDNANYVGTVDTSGQMRVPYLGTLSATGKTLDELGQDISLAVAGRQIQFVKNGVPTVIVLDDEDIFIDIGTYRPVTVLGAVSSPGRVPFEPGLNARAAIGSAGGAALFGQTDRVDQLANWRTRRAELAETEVWLAADLWRLDILLSERPSDSAVDAEYQIIEDRLDPRDIENIRQRIDGERTALNRERESISTRIVLAEKQITFLRTALSQFETASEIEEGRLQDVLQLSGRGLTTANVLDNAREGALNASSRLLTTQADLAQAERELESLRLSLQGLEEDFVQDLLNEKAQVERNYDEARARLDSLNRELALGMSIEADDEAPSSTRIILHRQVGEEETSSEARPSVMLLPGDVIEVQIIQN